MFVVPKAVRPVERASRWNLTYGWELRLLSGRVPKGANIMVNLPIAPDEYEVTERAAANVKHTIGGIHTEEAGFLERDIVVAGTCGLRSKRGWSPGSVAKPGGGMIYADGNTLWRHLRMVFRIYGDLKEHPGDKRVVMIWHDFRNDDHWVVVPDSWTMRRTSAEHRLHYPYEVEMTAVAEADGGSAGLFAVVRGATDVLVGGLNMLSGYVADAGAFIDETNATVGGAMGQAMGAVNRIIDEGAGVRQGLQDTLNLPKRAVIQARGLVDSWRTAVDELLTEGDPWSPNNTTADRRLAQQELAGHMAEELDAFIARPDVFAPSWRAVSSRTDLLEGGDGLLSQAEIDAAELRGETHPQEFAGLTERATPGSAIRARTARGSDARAARRWRGWRTYKVKRGDTVQGIAVREVGDPEAWVAIVEANDLAPPYLSSMRLPGTRGVGDLLAVPASQLGRDSQASDGVPEADRPADEIALGVDVKMSPDGGWEIDEGSGGTDVLLVRGVDCYIQGLERARFETRVGHNLVFPELGILAPVGQANGVGVPEAVAVSVRSAVLSDPRTGSIEDMRLEDAGDTVRIDVDVVPRGATESVPVSRPGAEE